MKRYLIMPKLGEALSQATILRWLKREGDKVEKGESICEIQTDKVTVEIESPFTGILEKIMTPEGAESGVGENMAIISNEG